MPLEQGNKLINGLISRVYKNTSEKAADIVKNSQLSQLEKYNALKALGIDNDDVKADMYKQLFEADKNGKKEEFTKIYNDLAAMGNTDMRTKLGNMYKKELLYDARIKAAVKARDEHNLTEYKKNIQSLENDGYKTGYIMTAINSWKNEGTQEEAKSAEDVFDNESDIYDYEMMFEAMQGGKAEEYENMLKEKVNAGGNKSSIISQVLKKQNEFAKKNGQTVISYDSLAEEALKNGRKSSKYNEIYDVMKKYGRTDENIKSGMMSSKTIQSEVKTYCKARYEGDYNTYADTMQKLLNAGKTKDGLNASYRSYVKKMK
ncbi:MAG: hypothetical protein LKJ25_04085 [Clostridia bacterium]|nr:hypothetical protein [Clostridia bacterium]